MQAAGNSAYSLICGISDTPSINWKIEMINSGVEPNPEFSVLNKNGVRA